MPTSSLSRHGQRRRLWLAATLASTVSTSGRTWAAREPARIAHLSGSGAVASRPFIESFRAGLAALGYFEGSGYQLSEHYAEGVTEALPRLVQTVLAGRPDVVLVATTPASLAFKSAARGVPGVVVLVADPVGNGIVGSLARPGGNITGITNMVAELAGKRLELLKEALPGARQVAVMINPDSQNAPRQLQSAKVAAAGLRIVLGPILEIRRPEDLEPAFQSAAKVHVAAAIRMIDPLQFMLRDQTAVLANRFRLPLIYPAREDVLAGGLMAYGADAPAQFRQAAGLVHRILQGAQPGDLPVEQPTQFALTLNQGAARAIGLTLPRALLLRADEVIG